jgi:hypothetical protein
LLEVALNTINQAKLFLNSSVQPNIEIKSKYQPKKDNLYKLIKLLVTRYIKLHNVIY